MQPSGQPFKRQSNLSTRAINPKPHFARVQEDNPECLFHSESRITKFCECRDCTLPLCQKCEQVHLEEHDKSKVRAVISSYSSVRERAMKDLPTLIRRYRSYKDELQRVLQAQYQLIEQNLQAYFDNLTKQIDSMWISESKLQELETRSDKIIKGSVKSLIQHYSDTYPEVKYPRLNINYSSSVLFSTLRTLVSVGGHTEGHSPNQNLTIATNAITPEVKRMEYSPKPAYTKPFVTPDESGPAVLQNGSFMAPHNIERQLPEFMPMEKMEQNKKPGDPSPSRKNETTTGLTRKVQPQGHQQLQPAQHQQTFDNTITRKKYEDFRDSYKKGSQFIPEPIANNRSNTTSVQARGEFKKPINQSSSPTPTPNLANQSSTSNILSFPQDPQQQRSPSFSTNNTVKPGSNPTMPAPKLTSDQIKQIINRKDQVVDTARNKSVEMKKAQYSKTMDIGQRFSVKTQFQPNQTSQPSQQQPLAKTEQGFSFNYSSVKNVGQKMAGENSNIDHHSSSPFANIKMMEEQQLLQKIRQHQPYQRKQMPHSIMQAAKVKELQIANNTVSKSMIMREPQQRTAPLQFEYRFLNYKQEGNVSNGHEKY